MIQQNEHAAADTIMTCYDQHKSPMVMIDFGENQVNSPCDVRIVQ